MESGVIVGTASESERLLTVEQAASVANCHEESIRRAYLCRQLVFVRFGVRSVRIRPGDLQGWINRGMRTRAA
jgi:excisionase family DNA binding protein